MINNIELEKILSSMSGKSNSLINIFSALNFIHEKNTVENLNYKTDKLNLLSESIAKFEKLQFEHINYKQAQISETINGYQSIIEEYKKTKEYSYDIQDKTKNSLENLVKKEVALIIEYEEEYYKIEKLFDEILNFYLMRLHEILDIGTYANQLSLIKVYEENEKKKDNEYKSA